MLLLLLATLTGCAGRQLEAPAYKPVEELAQCRPDECVEAKLRFRHWADAPYHRGRMIYHCDPGSELDGRADPGVTRLIFAIHGVVGSTPQKLAELSVDPGVYQLRSVTNALRRAHQLDPSLDPARIAIIAPTFQRTKQWQPYTDEDPRVWTWTRSTFNAGSLAKARESRSGVVKAEAVSSFDVIDEFLRAALIKFPNLDTVVLVGHSTGGQTVHRYALAGVGVHEHLEAEGIAVRYMPANPGGYAFPLPVRKMPPGQRSVPPGPGRGDTRTWRFGAPRGCKDHDEWGAGLSELEGSDRATRAANYAIEHYLRPVNRKLARKGLADEIGGKTWTQAARAALILQYASREIWHFQAATDRAESYGTSCRATLQGRSRFERFSNFQQLWVEKLGVPAPRLHFVALEDAIHPHASRPVYASEAGIHVLFQ